MAHQTETVSPVWEEEESEAERLAYKVDALEHELDSALDVLIRRINGERDLESAAMWLRLNYKKKAKLLRPRKPKPVRQKAMR